MYLSPRDTSISPHEFEVIRLPHTSTRAFQPTKTMEEGHVDNSVRSNGEEEDDYDEGEGETEEGLLDRDIQAKTAYYDYTAEKQMSQTDSKLFYQRSKLEAQKTGGSHWENSQHSHPGSPRSRAFSQSFGQEQGDLARSGSIHSMQSISNHPGKYKSALPIGLPSLDKPPGENIIQTPGIGVDPFGTASLPPVQSLLQADRAARSHVTHPSLPHEHKPLLENEGIHGAGAGVGLGTGAGGFAHNDDQITSELSAIYTNIQKVLDIRHKYIRLSLQGSSEK